VTRRILLAARRAARDAATPFYLFDPAELSLRAQAWTSAARTWAFQLLYPYKCNRETAVIERLALAGIGAEVAALSDLRRARRLGLGGEQIVLQGAAKDRELIDAGLAAGTIFVADGGEDALAILERARAAGKPPRYLLRLSTSGGDPSQALYGFSAADLVAFARASHAGRRPPSEGLAFHLGTGFSSPRPWREAIRAAGAVARALEAAAAPVCLLDVGGGFAAQGEARRDGRGRVRPAPPLPAEFLGVIAQQARRELSAATRLIAEPGRALASDAFHLVARVVRVKHSAAGDEVFLDASRMSHAFFVPRGRHALWAFPKRKAGRGRVRLWGPLGVDLEILVGRARIGVPRPGDLVVIGSVGAYNLNAANAWAGRKPPVVTAR
jgi:diaminopimelate decarboxylase